MKTTGDVTAKVILDTLGEMRCKTDELRAPKNTLLVLYLTQKIPAGIDLPECCVVVGRAGVLRLLEPFGTYNALLQGLFKDRR
jgi:hypothetical protein